MATNDPAEAAFLQDMQWVKCHYCLKSFEPSTKHYLFSCEHIACHDCASKMFVRERNSMNCGHCKKSVAFVQLRQYMDEKFGQMFKDPLKYAGELVKIHNFQQRSREHIILQLQKKLDRMKQNYNELQHRNNQRARELAEMRERTEPYVQEVLKIIPKARFDELLTMTEDQLKNMSFAELRGATSSRQSSVQASTPIENVQGSRHSSSSRSPSGLDDLNLHRQFRSNLNVQPGPCTPQPMPAKIGGRRDSQNCRRHSREHAHMDRRSSREKRHSRERRNSGERRNSRERRNSPDFLQDDIPMRHHSNDPKW